MCAPARPGCCRWSRVFAAWADPAAKARWSLGRAETTPEFAFDFRVGGLESYRGRPVTGPVHTVAARYCDIVPDRRIVYVYDVCVGGERVLVSLVTIEFLPEGVGTLVTEQAAFFRGDDTTLLEAHMRNVLISLETELRSWAGMDTQKQ